MSFKASRTHLAMIIVSSSCRPSLAVNLLLTNNDRSALVSSRTDNSSIVRLCNTRSNRRILEVGASGSKAAGRTIPAEGGEGASLDPSKLISAISCFSRGGSYSLVAGPSTFLNFKTTAAPCTPPIILVTPVLDL